MSQPQFSHKNEGFPLASRLQPFESSAPVDLPDSSIGPPGLHIPLLKEPG
jgi:hypothetical protein